MAKIRTIDPNIWRHKAFLNAPWHCREVFMYLFTVAADDEGRFEWEPALILENAFPRSYKVKLNDIVSDLEYLVTVSLVIRYGKNDEYGFLTGWWEHQYIQKEKRVPSSFPSPPVKISSWSDVDTIKAECCKTLKRKQQQVTYRVAIDWFNGELMSGNDDVMKCLDITEKNAPDRQQTVNATSPEGDPPVTPSIQNSDEPSTGGLTNGHPGGAKMDTGIGIGIGKGSTTISTVVNTLHEEGVPQQSSPDLDRENHHQQIPVPADMNIKRVSPEMIGAAVNRVFTGSRAISRDRWRLKLIEVAKDQHTPLSEEELIAALSEDTPSSVDTPETWCRRLLAKKSSRQRSAQQGNPLPPSTEKVITDEFGQVIPNASG